MRDLLLLALIMVFSLSVSAQDSKKAEDKEASYTKTITGRAEKIVATLGLTDSTKAIRVRDIITNQYRNLNTIYTARDEQVKMIRGNGAEKNSTDSLARLIAETYQAKVQKLHDPFISALSKELNNEQVIKVKDGMTYNVVSVTYKAMTDMIPSLKQNEKEQIMAWLVEARELAMDAESSEKKHWWFGKYKGKINNYLAAQGYDLQKERKEWEQRRKAQQDQKKASHQQ